MGEAKFYCSSDGRETWLLIVGLLFANPVCLSLCLRARSKFSGFCILSSFSSLFWFLGPKFSCFRSLSPLLFLAATGSYFQPLTVNYLLSTKQQTHTVSNWLVNIVELLAANKPDISHRSQ